MRRQVVYLLGASGSGKTSTARALLGTRTTEVCRWTVGDRFAAPGPYRGQPLDGPDALPPTESALRTVLERIDGVPPGRVVLLDGERYAKRWAVDWLRPRASLSAVLLEATVDVLRRRRERRGSPPMPASWYEQRIVQAEREAAMVGRVVRVDASVAALEVLARVTAALRGGPG